MNTQPCKSLVYVLGTANVEAITSDLTQYFQTARIWPYKAVNATTGAPTANAGTINVGQSGLGISVTLQSLIVTAAVATATTATAHGLSSGQYVTVSGATPSGCNGVFEIYETGATTFKYRVPASVADGPATGTITAARGAALPNPLTAATTVPLTFNTTLGLKRRLADIVVRGTATDGVYVEWE